MALEQIRELAKEVQDLQESRQYSAEPDKLRALTSLTLELATAVQDIHDRLCKLEPRTPLIRTKGWSDR
jgi:hypothetical protein